MEGAEEEEEKIGLGVSFSIRNGFCVIREAVGVETQEAEAYCPGFQKSWCPVEPTVSPT